MQAKLKLCEGCKEMTVIWKREGRLGYCKNCWSMRSPQKSKPTKQQPIARRSSKQQKLEAAYMVIRNLYIKNHPMCEAHLPQVCTQVATDVHHKKGRGEFLLDDTTYLAVCRGCHYWIEHNSREAKLLGFSISRLS